MPITELRERAEHALGQAPGSLQTLRANEREHILLALRDTGWVLAGPNGAAALLGMKRTTLQSRMHKLGIQRPT